MTLVGGAGNDTLVGGAGVDVLLGGAGNDVLRAGSGRALLVGGTGVDSLTGGSTDDILIGAQLAYYDETTGALDASSLNAIMSEWSRTDRNFSSRLDDLFNGGGLNGSSVLNSSTVLDDGVLDSLVEGTGGQDWFLVSAAGEAHGNGVSDLVTIL